jgi:hypothetical protein
VFAYPGQSIPVAAGCGFDRVKPSTFAAVIADVGAGIQQVPFGFSPLKFIWLAHHEWQRNGWRSVSPCSRQASTIIITGNNLRNQNFDP